MQAMRAIAGLALTEFLRAFRLPSAPGGRDLFWLTLLLVGLQLHALVVLSARDGVLNNSVDAFIGYEPGYGVPVRVLPNALRGTYAGAIDQPLIEAVAADGFAVAPYRRYRNRAMLRPPGDGVWRARAGLASDVPPSFAGLAADPDGPLWPAAKVPPPASGGPRDWRIALDRDVWAEFFDLAAYRASLRGRIPDAELAAIPEDPARLNELRRLWLELRVHATRLVPFEITWAENIGFGAERVAFVAPLDLWHLVSEAQRNPPELCLFLEQGPGLGRRIATLSSARLMPGADRAALREAFAALEDRLPGALERSATRVRYRLGTDDQRRAYQRGRRCDPGFSEARVLAIAAELGLPLDPKAPGELILGTEPVRIGPFDLTLPCEAVLDTRREEGDEIDEDGRCLVRLPLAERSYGFEEALVFAPSRLAIAELVDYLTCAPVPGYPAPEDRRPLCIDPGIDRAGDPPDPRLRLDEVYQDTLARFNFLTSLIEQLKGPIGGLILALLLATLWVQLGTVIGHRRVRYGMLLANGVTWVQLRAILVLQVTAAVVSSLALAAGLFWAIRAALAPGTEALAARYSAITKGGVPEPLPSVPADLAFVGGTTLLVAVALALFQVWRSGVARRRALEHLLR